MSTLSSGHQQEVIVENPFANSLPNELWTFIQAKNATFALEHFHHVMENLIKNPNITSSCVFRADVYYDSAQHAPEICEDGTEAFNSSTKHLKEEYRPREFTLQGYEIARSLVRKMIPRNPALDAPLVQTCYFFRRRYDPALSLTETVAEGSTTSDELLVMIPHVSDIESIPFYHPKVRRLALRYASHSSSAIGSKDSSAGKTSLSIYYSLFAGQSLDNRLERTAQNLLNIIHKHARGQADGYLKRVHHDLIVPQQRFQDTYTRLKLQYAKELIASWAEQTDPTKHVFEDLGIAAFLIELWKDLYPPGVAFPGFVDIGCGNGVLVFILIKEGYRGRGFDARARKSWNAFPADVQSQLTAKILVPFTLLDEGDLVTGPMSSNFENGLFDLGTFIISNHADELTPWTPLLAWVSQSPFIAIPCCSHNLAGARCRFSSKEMPNGSDVQTNGSQTNSTPVAQSGPGPATGSLAKPKNASKQPSAYQSLTTYVSNMGIELGFGIRKEMLRIPSTRNAAIVGMVATTNGNALQLDDSSSNKQAARKSTVSEIVRREVGDLNPVRKDWLGQADKIANSKSSGH